MAELAHRRRFSLVYIDGILLKRTWAEQVRNVSAVIAIGVSEDSFRQELSVAEEAKEGKAGCQLSEAPEKAGS